jgi:UMF1 family MFS transporter
LKKLNWSQVHAWATYDFAINVFSLNMISTYFALWVIKDHGASDLTYGLAKGLSMAIVALVSPLIGSLSDRAGNRKPYLAACIALYIGCSLILGFTHELWLGLVLFGIANIGMQLSTVFYNAYLPGIATPQTIGRISGYGKMLSYVGSLVAVLVGMAFATGKLLGHPLPLPAGGSQAVFIPTALLALVASLPILLLLRQPPREEGAPAPSGHAASWGQILRELKDSQKLPGVGLFLIASFFFFDTVNTLRDFMSIYMVKVVGLSETGGSLQSFLLVVVLCSLVGAIVWGFLTDKLGPKKALVGVLAMLAISFGALTVVTAKGLVLGVIGPMAGIAFGGVLVTTRPLLARLVPQDRLGEFFGLFILANDFGAILGPISWGVTVELLKAQGLIAYQAAVGVQLVFLVLGLVLVTRVPVPEKQEAAVLPEASVG